MPVDVKSVHIGVRSRFRVWLLRLFFKRLMGRMGRGSEERIALLQVRAAGRLPEQCSGLNLEYRIINEVPGPMLGDSQDAGKLVILYLHGGAFVFPASPALQLEFLGRLCRDSSAVGFMPDYRLVPQHPAPAALDDCERAYRGLLALGYPPKRIVVVGESAGGNLVLGLLQRIRKANLGLPACAVPISPITDLARMHAPPSRGRNAKREALVPLSLAYRMTQWYVGGQDASDPEISPLYADYCGFPPLYFIASEREILLDDSILAVRQARQARDDITAFIRKHAATLPLLA